MKLIKLALISVFIFVINASYSEEKTIFIDELFYGVWKGSDTNRHGQLEKWVQTLKPDHTFKVKISVYKNGKLVKNITEEGKWEIKDGIFHQQIIKKGKTVAHYKYFFEIKSLDKIYYNAIGYKHEFTDTKISDL